MEYTKEVLENKKVKFIINLTSEEWEKELDHVYEHERNHFKVEGFRAGKAPRKVVEKLYGETVFYNDALNEAFYHNFDQVLSKEPEVKMVGNPSIDVKKLDQTGLTLVVTIDVVPEAKLGKYTGLKVEKDAVKVDEKDIEAELKKMQEKASRLVKVEREAKLGDEVNFDFEGFIDGKAFEGGKAEKYNLVLGSGNFIPGFEDQMVGLKAGDDKDINVTFPENYHAEALKGKPAVFKIHIHEVREKIVPELDDELASQMSEYDTLKEYKESIEKDLLKAKEQENEYKFEEKLIEAVVNNAEVDVPESMVEAQVEEYLHQFAHQLEHYGIKLEDYVNNYMHTTIDELKKSRYDDARRTCKTQIVLDAIIKAEKLEATEEDLEKEIAKQALKLNSSVEDVKKTLDEHTLMHMQSNAQVEKLLTFLKENN